MIIKGKNVVLRAIEREDAELLRGMMNDPQIESMMWGYSFPVSKQGQEAWMSNLGNEKNVFRAIIEVDGVGIGQVILSDIDMKNGNAEIHIKLADSNVRGKGYGTDAVETITKYAFEELRLNCVFCRVRVDNTPSRKVFEKCGYQEEGILRSRVYREGKYHDFVEYSILKSDMESI